MALIALGIGPADLELWEAGAAHDGVMAGLVPAIHENEALSG